jgi:hypothetical protein
MKPRSSRKKKPVIILTIADSTWHVLARLAATPRELFIHLSQTDPDRVRSLSDADTKKLLTKITPTQIAQLVLRTWLQRSARLTEAEFATLGESRATLDLIARGIIHDHPENYRQALQKDSTVISASKPFEKRLKHINVSLTANENASFRKIAGRMRVGPSELGGLLLERFAHYFPGLTPLPASRQPQKGASHA